MDGYKDMITASGAEDIVYSNLFTGVHGNYLKKSIVASGMDPDNLPVSDPSKMNFGTDASGERRQAKGPGRKSGAAVRVSAAWTRWCPSANSRHVSRPNMRRRSIRRF